MESGECLRAPNKIIFRLLSATLSVALSRPVLAQAPGKSSLPKDEHSVEKDLEEDDGSATPPPTESAPKHLLDAKEAPFERPAPEPPAQLRQRPDEPAAPYTGKQNTGALPMEYRSSGASGEKVFDWSKHQNETEVAHPYAEKGLIRISKDKTYYYKVEESPQDRAADMHVGSFNPIHLSNPDQQGKRGATFEENYDQTSNPAVLLNYEWQMWRNPLGKFGLRIGSGIFVAQGHGHFVGDVNQAKTPREVFTFAVFPNAIGAVFRFHWYHRQLFVPYVEGGGNLFAFTEFRDDNKPPKFGGALGAYGVGGLAINLTYFDYLSRIQLDREYGINACYLIVEYRTLVAVTKHYDFSSDFVNAGFLMEF